MVADSPPEGQRTARGETRRRRVQGYLLRLTPRALAAALAAVVLATGFALLARPPVVEYSGATSVLNFTVDGQDQVVWNLPAKVLASLSITPDGEPVTGTTPIGLGPLVLPRGTAVLVTRLPGEALPIHISGVGREAPYLLAGSQAGPIRVGKGDTITVRERTASPTQAEPECRVPLPPMMFRGAGAITVGAPLNLDAYDTPDVLARMQDDAFVDRMVQPQLVSGEITLLARVVFGTDTYPAAEIQLQPGDVVHFSDKVGAAETPAIFVLQVRECEPITLRGVQRTRDALLVRIGGDATRLAIQPWQVLTKDGVISLLAALSGLVAALLGALANASQLLDAARKRASDTPETTEPEA